MANYVSACRSNYFKIGRPKEFMEWIDKMPGVVFEPKEKTSEPEDLVGMIYVDDMDGGGWPTYGYDEKTDEEFEIDFENELAEFLAPGEVVILMEVGGEKLRYLSGYATAINDKKEYLVVSLCDIYNKVADEWGIENISVAEY